MIDPFHRTSVASITSSRLGVHHHFIQQVVVRSDTSLYKQYPRLSVGINNGYCHRPVSCSPTFQFMAHLTYKNPNCKETRYFGTFILHRDGYIFYSFNDFPSFRVWSMIPMNHSLIKPSAERTKIPSAPVRSVLAGSTLGSQIGWGRILRKNATH